MKVINIVELGNFNYLFYGIELKASLPQFSGIRPPQIITESKVFNTIDFSSYTNPKVARKRYQVIIIGGYPNA